MCIDYVQDYMRESCIYQDKFIDKILLICIAYRNENQSWIQSLAYQGKFL
jgi:hypothetical protein